MNHDTDIIRDILADQVEFVVKGQVEVLKKEDYLAKREDVLKKLILVDFNSGQVNVETKGNDASIEFNLRLRIESDSGTPTEHVGTYIYRYRKNETGWKITSIKLL